MLFLFSVLIFIIIIILLFYIKGTLTAEYNSKDKQVDIELNISDRYHKSYKYKMSQNPWEWYRLDKKRRNIYIIPMLLKRIAIERINWETTTGGGDAMDTALKAGSIWAFKGVFIAYVSNIAALRDLKINVTPDFNNNGTSSSLSCIFRIRLVHIMVMITHIECFKIRRYFKWKHSSRGVPTILSRG